MKPNNFSWYLKNKKEITKVEKFEIGNKKSYFCFSV